MYVGDMRKIKFRGKSVDEGKWLIGALVPNGQRPCIAPFGDGFHLERVDPSTIGQFTGLTDCNGKEIYEGDIVRYTDANDETTTSTVRFVDCAFSPLTEIIWMGNAECDIIGNIHDNPEQIPKQPTAI